MKMTKALREQVWINSFGRVFEHKCYIPWCSNIINVFDYQVGHDVPRSKGGERNLDNLKPLCSRCNQCMENSYTIEEWSNIVKKQNTKSFFCCFIPK